MDEKIERILMQIKRSGTELLAGVFGVRELLELKAVIDTAAISISEDFTVPETYCFTAKMPNQICRICGSSFETTWSYGGVGAICLECKTIRESLDLVNMGIVKDIDIVNLKGVHTFIFKAKVDGKWYDCHTPCGDWSYIRSAPLDVFSVPVGYWELKNLYKRHYQK